jgi:hypothetical protein
MTNLPATNQKLCEAEVFPAIFILVLYDTKRIETARFYYSPLVGPVGIQTTTKKAESSTFATAM